MNRFFLLLRSLRRLRTSQRVALVSIAALLGLSFRVAVAADMRVSSDVIQATAFAVSSQTPAAGFVDLFDRVVPSLVATGNWTTAVGAWGADGKAAQLLHSAPRAVLLAETTGVDYSLTSTFVVSAQSNAGLVFDSDGNTGLVLRYVAAHGVAAISLEELAQDKLTVIQSTPVNPQQGPLVLRVRTVGQLVQVFANDQQLMAYNLNSVQLCAYKDLNCAEPSVPNIRVGLFSHGDATTLFDDVRLEST